VQKTEALVLPSNDGIIYFYMLGRGMSFKFDFEIRIKAVKIGHFRLFGRAEKPVKCLFVFTFEDYAFVFYDFVFEVNTQHVAFKQAIQRNVLLNLQQKMKTSPS
jgi:hypothetical protein